MNQPHSPREILSRLRAGPQASFKSHYDVLGLLPAADRIELCYRLINELLAFDARNSFNFGKVQEAFTDIDRRLKALEEPGLPQAPANEVEPLQ